MKQNITILVLGGYGKTGKILCRYLLKETDVNVIVAGRRLEKAEELADKLKQEFLPERISARYADASDLESLRQGFDGIDLVLVAATTTKWAQQIAETALEANIDYLDIYFKQDVYSVLETMQQRIENSGKCFITQAGFHPGLPAAYIRQGAQYFDRYNRANLSNAKLSEALMFEVDLRPSSDYRTNLSHANLSHADLSYANLSMAILYQANLDGAKLCRANLSAGMGLNTDLTEASLQGADLSYADFKGAILSKANLQNADLTGTNLDDADLTEAIMPDGSLYKNL